MSDERSCRPTNVLSERSYRPLIRMNDRNRRLSAGGDMLGVQVPMLSSRDGLRQAIVVNGYELSLEPRVERSSLNDADDFMRVCVENEPVSVTDKNYTHVLILNHKLPSNPPRQNPSYRSPPGVRGVQAGHKRTFESSYHSTVVRQDSFWRPRSFCVLVESVACMDSRPCEVSRTT